MLEGILQLLTCKFCICNYKTLLPGCGSLVKPLNISGESGRIKISTMAGASVIIVGWYGAL